MITGWTLPEAVEVAGKEYRINTDYRDMLEILHHLGDQGEPEYVRALIALALFYEDFDQMDERDYQQALEKLYWFMQCGQEEDRSHPPVKRIDWEQDQPLIVADINKVAGCEIRALPFCHWWTFISWFNGIGEGQLSAVVSIREKRRTGKKLADWEKEFYQENKSLVDFRKRYTEEEETEKERLLKLLGE